MNQPDEDALWRSIVDNYGERATLDAGPSAPSEPTGPAESDRIVEAPAPAPGPSGERGADRTFGRDAGSDRLDAWDDPDDHFVPPEPPPLPRLAPPQLLAWAGVLGMPVLTVLMAVLHVAVPVWGGLLGLVWFVGGFCFLVATMRRDRDDDDWDDGAVL